jgi:two-component system KDP operon response regulator KdpE
MQAKKILLVDDDVNLRQSLKIDFTRAGATVYAANDGQTALKLFYYHQPDLVILDINMPVMNGWETCKQIRMVAETPIIMLTSANLEQDVVRGLEYGADDFVTKPFSRNILTARINAVLRRTDQGHKEGQVTVYDDQYLRIDCLKRQVRVRGELIKLSSTEFKLLAYFLEHRNQTLSYQTILSNVWGWEYQNEIDYVHVYVSHIRRKIEEDPRNPRYLLTVHNVGYTFTYQDE